MGNGGAGAISMLMLSTGAIRIDVVTRLMPRLLGQVGMIIGYLAERVCLAVPTGGCRRLPD